MQIIPYVWSSWGNSWNRKGSQMKKVPTWRRGRKFDQLVTTFKKHLRRQKSMSCSLYHTTNRRICLRISWRRNFNRYYCLQEAKLRNRKSVSDTLRLATNACLWSRKRVSTRVKTTHEPSQIDTTICVDSCPTWLFKSSSPIGKDSFTTSAI